MINKSDSEDFEENQGMTKLEKANKEANKLLSERKKTYEKEGREEYMIELRKLSEELKESVSKMEKEKSLDSKKSEAAEGIKKFIVGWNKLSSMRSKKLNISTSN